MNDRVLFVDDDEQLLTLFANQLRDDYEIFTALDPEKGLSALQEEGPFSVVVSDLRMPGQDGVDFLCHVREQSPEVVRVMMTGFPDTAATLDAVNKGHVFRFLTKPCEPGELRKAVHDSVEQFHLLEAERERARETLLGSIKLLTDVLSLVNPVAFSRANRLRRYVSHMARRLKFPNIWCFEVAAMLSQTGCVALHPETLYKVYAGKPLTADEECSVATHPDIACSLIENIPGLEKIAAMVARQRQSYSEFRSQNDGLDTIESGAQMLRIATDFDQMLMLGTSPQDSLARLHSETDEYDPLIVDALSDMPFLGYETIVRSRSLSEIERNSILAEDVRTRNGRLLVAKGQELTFAVLQHMRSYRSKREIGDSFRVQLPPGSVSPDAPGSAQS